MRRNPHYPTLVDNPEYQFMAAREYTNVPMSLAYAPIGLPLGNGGTNYPPQASHPPMYNQSQNPSTHPLNNNAQKHQLNSRPSSIVRHSSRSEEESDHEYYNELDKLKREMQPLQQPSHKNETTV